MYYLFLFTVIIIILPKRVFKMQNGKKLD